MAKKKFTRDIPLPSSDSMFGGPGDPKRKYTAQDSVRFHNDFLPTRKGLKREVKDDWEMATRPPGHPMQDPTGERYVRSSERLKNLEAEGRKNPYATTYSQRTNDPIKTGIRDTPSSKKTRRELFPPKQSAKARNKK